MKTSILKCITVACGLLITANTALAQEADKKKAVKIMIVKNGDTTIIERSNGELTAEDVAKLEKLKVDGSKHKTFVVRGFVNAKHADSLTNVIIRKKGDGVLHWEMNGEEFNIVTTDSIIRIMPPTPPIPPIPPVPPMMDGKEFQFKEGKLFIDGKEINIDKDIKGKVVISPKSNNLQESVYLFRKDGNERKVIIRMLNPSESDLKNAKNEALAPARILDTEELRIYPNPSPGKFTLQFSLKEKGDTQVEVLDVNGKVIFSDKLKGFTGNYKREIDLPETAGVYLINITQNGKKQVKKVVKE